MRPPGAERSVYDLLLGARRAVLGNPAAAGGLHDLLVAEGRRYADTPAGAQLRDALITSEAVENLRRVWETVSLNVLDGPAPQNCGPDRVGRAAGRRGHRARPRRFHPGPPPARGLRMTLTDPREALAEQSNFIGYLMGLASSAKWCMRLARRRPPSRHVPRCRRLRPRAARRRAPRRGRRATRRIRTGSTHWDGSPRASDSTNVQVAAMTAALAGSDFLRAPVLATAHADGIQGVAPLRGARRGSPALDQLQPHQRDRLAPVDTGWRRASS